ncbi:MAG: hypothetical protein ABJA67_12875 [Chthonomonadales bacterium]
MALPRASGPLQRNHWSELHDVQKCASVQRMRAFRMKTATNTRAIFHDILHKAPEDGHIRWQAVLVAVIVIASMCAGTVFLMIDVFR